ncbi:MAG: hypothetical protein Q8O86_10780 [Dehalococcoidia bacterium]|nr:hypothetical protein [Dehalococcoidia bacterium]
MDRLVKVDLPDGQRILACEIKKSGQPRVVREAVNQLLRYRQSLHGVLFLGGGMQVAAFFVPAPVAPRGSHRA